MFHRTLQWDKINVILTDVFKIANQAIGLAFVRHIRLLIRVFQPNNWWLN